MRDGVLRGPVFLLRASALWQQYRMTDKAIIVHSLEHAETAMAAADELGIGVTLLSAADAAAFMGAKVFREITEQALAAHPNVSAKAVLDCGADAGRAMNALRNGVKIIRLHASEEVTKKIADIAAQQDAREDNSVEKVLDLATADDPATACRNWLIET